MEPPSRSSRPEGRRYSLDQAELRELRRECERRLEQLEVPIPFVLQEFVDQVARRRGRPIVVQPIQDLGPSAVGCWIAIEEPPTDLILHAETITTLHAEHIVLHELSHIICEHQPRVADPSLSSRLFPDLSPDLVAGMLNRSAYSSREEMEAEMLATLIRLRAAGHADPRATGLEGEVVKRLEAFAKGEPPA